MENRLRALALKQYPNDADAVINVDAANNEAGTATTVSGEVVEVQDHTTAACMLRDTPPVIDGAAQSAVGGMLGTLAGGLITGSPQAAEGGGVLGATAAGSIAVIQHRQAVEQQAQDTRATLADQQQTIVSLQKARAQLTECKEEETPLSQCGNVQSAANQTAPPDTPDEPDWSASQFDLEKQVEIQQDYIAKLQAQIGDLKHDMRASSAAASIGFSQSIRRRDRSRANQASVPTSCGGAVASAVPYANDSLSPSRSPPPCRPWSGVQRTSSASTRAISFSINRPSGRAPKRVS